MGRGGGALCFFCEICICKISDSYISCSLLLAPVCAQSFSIFYKNCTRTMTGVLLPPLPGHWLLPCFKKKKRKGDSLLCNDSIIPANLMIHCLISRADFGFLLSSSDSSCGDFGARLPAPTVARQPPAQHKRRFATVCPPDAHAGL